MTDAMTDTQRRDLDVFRSMVAARYGDAQSGRS